MTKFGLLSTSALGSAALVAFSSPAFAADTAAAQPSDAAAATQPNCTPEQAAAGTCTLPQVASSQPSDEGSIVVTGTRIRTPNLVSNVPITSVAPDELPNQGQASLGDALNDLPALRSTFSQENSGRFIGTAGNNFLDLRGLGESRTLVLVNGRRHITSSVGDFIVDINTIPQDLLERVDIVTGGESAVYGSDAIAGVVNFILRDNFDGIRLHAQGGISSRGDRGVDVVTLTAGRNFADNRANIAVSLEYTHAEPLYFGDRPALTGAFSGRCQYQLTERTVGEPQAGDGIPDNTFLCGIRNASISDGGTIGVISSASGAALRFDPNGNLFIDTPSVSYLPFGSGNVQGGQGTTLRDTGQLAVGQDRYIGNLLAHYDITPAFQLFVEAKYVRQRVLQEGQPSFFQGQLSNFFGPGVPNLRCNNPFLTSQALTTLQSFGLCTNPATGTFGLSRFNVDFGGRREVDTRDTYRIVGGIRGDFNGDWHYEISLNYGHFKSTNAELNDLVLFDVNGNPDGFSLAVDAVRNSAGQIVCRVNQTAVTRPDCVPINVFGYGAPSQAALNFVNTTSHLYSHASELDALAFVSGDFSQLFELPGGPIAFSIGAEYRRETAFQQADPLSASGGTFFNAFGTFNPPALSVKEVFGELSMPLLRDLPFAHELTVSGAARYSDYNTSANHTFAWNVNGTWAPVSDIRFRANYSRSVRVPTLSDLYSPNSQNFAFIADPCDAANINNGTSNRPGNCAALGVPTTANAADAAACAGTGFPSPAGGPFINCLARSFSTGFSSGGNPNLQEETGRSLTIGAVVTPRFLPGFSLTVDYFDIKVTNLIATLSAQTILNQCVDLPSLSNQFCASVFPRDPATGFFNNPAVLSAGVNFAKQTSRGIDADMTYRHTFANGLRLNLRGIGTYTLERTNYISPTDPNFADRQLSELGDPVFSGTLITGIGMGAWDIQYSLRYIGKQTITSYEATHSLQGRPPTNPDFANRVYYPDVLYHDVRLNYRISQRYTFYLGVDDLFDKLPPLGLLGTEAGSPFTSIGRFLYAGATVNF